MIALGVLHEDLRVEQAGTDVHAQNYQFSFNFGSEPSNPVQARLIKIEQIEGRIKQLERLTKPITKLINDLDTPENLKGSNNKVMLEILKLMYFGKNNSGVIADELHMAKRTFLRLRRELVYIAMGYLAF